MLTIRQAQLFTLGVEHSKRFLERAIDFLCTHFPEEGATTRSELRQRWEPLLEKARGYELHTEQQAMGYLIACKHFGHNFDVAHPDAATILLHDQLNADEKLACLEQLLGYGKQQ